MPYAVVNDINMYYEIHGKGEPLVFISSAGVSTAMSGPRQIPAFSSYYRLVLFDNRGSGQSDAPDIPYSMEMMADDVAGLLNAIAVDSAHILGNTIGGEIAQHFAIRHPERVISLILESTTCGGPHSVPVNPEVQKIGSDSLTLAERRRKLIEFGNTREFLEKNPGIFQEGIAREMEHPAPPHGRARQFEANSAHDTYDQLPEIKAPTLVIHGELDLVLPVENARILASRIPGSELMIFKNAGHQLREVEKERNTVILDFLKKHRRRE